MYLYSKSYFQNLLREYSLPLHQTSVDACVRSQPFMHLSIWSAKYDTNFLVYGKCGDLGELVPDELHGNALWYIKLDPCARDMIPGLLQSANLTLANIPSDDLLDCPTVLSIGDGPDTLKLNTEMADMYTLTEEGCVVVAIDCDDELWLTVYIVDEGCRDDWRNLAYFGGSNYRAELVSLVKTAAGDF